MSSSSSIQFITIPSNEVSERAAGFFTTARDANGFQASNTIEDGTKILVQWDEPVSKHSDETKTVVREAVVKSKSLFQQVMLPLSAEQYAIADVHTIRFRNKSRNEKIVFLDNERLFDIKSGFCLTYRVKPSSSSSKKKESVELADDPVENFDDDDEEEEQPPRKVAKPLEFTKSSSSLLLGAPKKKQRLEEEQEEEDKFQPKNLSSTFQQEEEESKKKTSLTDFLPKNDAKPTQGILSEVLSEMVIGKDKGGVIAEAISAMEENVQKEKKNMTSVQDLTDDDDDDDDDTVEEVIVIDDDDDDEEEEKKIMDYKPIKTNRLAKETDSDEEIMNYKPIKKSRLTTPKTTLEESSSEDYNEFKRVLMGQTPKQSVPNDNKVFEVNSYTNILLPTNPQQHPSIQPLVRQPTLVSS